MVKGMGREQQLHAERLQFLHASLSHPAALQQPPLTDTSLVQLQGESTSVVEQLRSSQQQLAGSVEELLARLSQRDQRNPDIHKAAPRRVVRPRGDGG